MPNSLIPKDRGESFFFDYVVNTLIVIARKSYPSYEKQELKNVFISSKYSSLSSH
jgi:hypothetical protein